LYLISNSKINAMIAANFTEFRTELKKYLDNVENNHETLVIKRKSGKGAVLISLDEYNSIMETVHLLSSKANADRLYESIQQMEKGEIVKQGLIEDE
jgi:antitoxin YefM